MAVGILLTHKSYQARITNQLRRLGGSYDWDRVAFTMNPVSDTSFWSLPVSWTTVSLQSRDRDILPIT